MHMCSILWVCVRVHVFMCVHVCVNKEVLSQEIIIARKSRKGTNAAFLLNISLETSWHIT